MAIKTGLEKSKDARFRVCCKPYGLKLVVATCDTTEDVREYLSSAACVWRPVAVGVDGCYSAGTASEIEVRDRTIEYRGNDDRCHTFGVQQGMARRSAVAANPRQDD